MNKKKKTDFFSQLQIFIGQSFKNELKIKTDLCLSWFDHG